MSAESLNVEADARRGAAQLLADRLGWSSLADGQPLIRGLTVIALAIGFVLIGGGSLNLGPIESRLGIAAGEPFGPFGRVYGGWEPSLWPAQVALSRVWDLV